MSPKPFDIIAVGNAIVDVFGQVDDLFLLTHGIEKNVMTLLDADRFARLYDALTSHNRPQLVSGGSAANTAVGVAAFGGAAAFVGRVFDDALGAAFTADIRAAGVAFNQLPAVTGSPTASSIILVTPDAARSMNTFLGASIEFEPDDLTAATVADTKIIYLEGYLFDAPNGPAIFAEAARLAHANRVRIALSLSDPWCVERHRDALADFINDHVSVLLGNEDEIVSLCGTDCEVAAAQLVTRLDEVVVTRGPNGAMVLSGAALHHIAAMPQGPVVDTTGAGDLFAAGYLYGRTNGYDLEASAHLASVSAGEVITHIGARPKTDLKKLATSIPKF